MDQDPEIKKAIVVVAGVARLAVAVKLRKQGYKLDVFEANNHPGGGIPLCLLSAKINSSLIQNHE